MFEPISTGLWQLSVFAILGFFLGGFYEIIRIIRLFKRQNDFIINMTDFLFLTVCGVITFAYSLELGNGHFRWFYIAGVIFGGAVYFLTVGKLVSLMSNLIVRCIKYILRKINNLIIVPIIKNLGKFIHFIKRKIVYSYSFSKKHAINSIKHLKSKAKVLYNKGATKMKRNKRNNQPVGEERNVIKGKIRRSF